MFTKFQNICFLLLFVLLITITRDVIAAEKTSLTLTYDGKTHKYTAEAINLVINGKKATNLAMPPIIFNDFTLVPAREVFEPLNAVVDWNAINQEVYVTYGNSLLILRMNDNMAEIDGKTIEMPIAPKIINDKTMIPLRFVADSFNYLLNWDPDTRTAYIDEIHSPSDKKPAPEENTTETSVPNNSGNTIVSNEEENLYKDNNDNSEININTNTNISDSTTSIPAKDVSSTTLSSKNYSETSINSIIIPGNGENRFVIQATSEISRIEKALMPDNRMYIDIYNSKLDITNTSYTITDNPNVASVRTGQFQMEPTKITRVVFDLKDGVEYDVSVSEDRKSIFVSFVRNRIQNVVFSTNGSEDTIIIYGKNTPDVSVFYLPSPERLVMDIPFADLENIVENNVDGRYGASIRSSQFDSNTVRIVIDLKDRPAYVVKTGGNTTIIKLIAPTYKNMIYDDKSTQLIIKKNAGFSLDINKIIHKDDYGSFRYTLTLPGDYSAYLGYGEYLVRDPYVNSFSISTNTNTEIKINETRILAYIITEDAQNIYIRAVLPKEKYDKIVVIDAGHGGGDNGTSGFGMLEKDLNFDIVNRVITLVEQNSKVKIYSTRTTDIKPSLEERAEFGNIVGDIFISVHHNYNEIRKGVRNPKANGTETFYYPHDNDETIGFTSKKVAEIVQKGLVNELKSTDRSFKSTPYVVLKQTKIPAVLCEIGFLSNEEEAMKISTDAYRQKAAMGIYKAIVEIMNEYNPKR